MKQLWALVATVMSCATLSAQDVELSDNRSWTFTSMPQTDVSLISSDANWKKDSKSRYCMSSPWTMHQRRLMIPNWKSQKD